MDSPEPVNVLKFDFTKTHYGNVPPKWLGESDECYGRELSGEIALWGSFDFVFLMEF